MNRLAVKKVKKKRKVRKFVLFTLIIALGLIGFGGYKFYQTYTAASKSYNDLGGREKSKLREEVVTISKDPVSILLMGIEDYSTEGVNGRTDSLMLITFNPKDERMKLLSIPRDTYVEIVGRGTMDKINHAHVFGGKEMTIDTVEKFLDIPVDYYAAVDFDAFIEIIDILGGITVNVPFDFEEKTMAPGSRWVQFYEGPMELNGEEALAFARMRKQDPKGDIGRAERQQEIIKAIVDKATSFNTITKIDDIAETIGNNIETNMRITEGLAFYKAYPNFSPSNIDQIKFESHSERMDGIVYEIADEESVEEVRQILKQHLELTDSDENVFANEALEE
ncbi:LCP family protein required for cell wall assembly [Cerasibacillus quisquiliarum]|uniref:Putative transcriptional regulator YvhJ n=1 Tax=Cerasibacillus quisquiliarum TaxID=227865 RepID=A0A511UZZ9_9BACI|nr:LCP family protein [Cerasibacillus quisquiliarum]MBB5147227.1 LCP family protein required for cell wall assembly [Cerasibacillus quisquiliarum]GEN32230.1 putative transcriptional regulator YvhJ [Cerasibacillus quisquiliarum]